MRYCYTSRKAHYQSEVYVCVLCVFVLGGMELANVNDFHSNSGVPSCHVWAEICVMSLGTT